VKLPDRWRPHTYLASGLLILLAGWILFVPVTAIYEVTTDDPAPRDVSTAYSWWTPEQKLIYPNVSASWNGPIDPANVLEGHRLGCGNSFTTGQHESIEEPSGPAACGAIETPRRVIGIILLVSGALGLIAAIRMRDRFGGRTTRYRQPYSQRRALRRGR
jgi:hypothetical protein